MIATVVIPNYNGKRYLKACLNSLRRQTRKDFQVILIDNGSSDGSVELIRTQYPEVILRTFETNRGFCGAVNEGIRMSSTRYVILLNNDTACAPSFVEEMVRGIEAHPDCFSAAARMVQMQQPDRMDNAGDYYCAFGWAYALGKGKPARQYAKEREIFSACAAAAIYRRSVFERIGLFDETHFAYLEDVDVAYRARIEGFCNLYLPGALVKHVGSATSGSVYNEFKIRYSSRNSVYLVYKNMPWPQLLLNLPFLTAGFLIKLLFFARRGFGKEYASGLWKGAALCDRSRKVKFQKKNLKNYLQIQWELWVNMFRRLSDF